MKMLVLRECYYYKENFIVHFTEQQSAKPPLTNITANNETNINIL